MNVIDIQSQKITNWPAMEDARSAHASVFFANSVFVAGGQTSNKSGTFIVNSAEK